MAQLDNKAATLFSRLCSLAVSIHIQGVAEILDARVVSMGNAGNNSLQPYGLGFGALNILHEYGLIIPDYNSYMTYVTVVDPSGRVAMPITFQKKFWALIPKAGPTIPPQPYNIHGVGLSGAGKELMSVVDIQPDAQYAEALRKYFDSQSMIFTQVAGTPPA